MLVLTRKYGQQIKIGDEITVTVLECKGGRVRLGIEAAPHIPIVREEIRSEFHQEAPAAPARQGKELLSRG